MRENLVLIRAIHSSFEIIHSPLVVDLFQSASRFAGRGRAFPMKSE